MSDLKDFVIENGVLKKYKGNGGDVVIPGGVTSINKNAFYMCKSLTSVTIPEGVTSIGSEAFYDCFNLKSITIPEGVKRIGAWAFSSCVSLKSITIPDSVEKLGSFIFSDSGLRYLYAKHLKAATWWKNQDIMLPAIMGFLLHHKEFTDKAIIDEYKKHVFSKKKKLLQLIFEDDMVSGVEFYASTGKITAKNFEEEFLLPAQTANATQCIAFLLEWKEKNLSHVKPEKQLRNGLEDSVTLPELKKIWAFEKMDDGTLCITNYKGEEINVAIPKCIGKNTVTAIGNDAFSIQKPSRPKAQREVLKKLETVIVPDGITSIGENAFWGCENLTSIIIPDSVTNIGCNAFEDCKNLVNINIPESVKSIGRSAFSGCKGLADNDGLIIVCGVVYDYVGKSKRVTIPSGVTSIDAGAFRDLENITSINIPESVVSIGEGAFSHCESLESITIPEGVTTVGERMFSYCKSLASITMPDTITIIGDNAFSGCESLTGIAIPNSVVSIGDSAFKGCKSLADKDGFVIVHGVLYDYVGDHERVEIPDNIIGVSKNAFAYCKNLTSVVIPDSVTSLDEWTFLGCTMLSSITIPDTVKSIAKYAMSIWDSKNLTIHAPAGSYAERYAKENNIPFIAE